MLLKPSSTSAEAGPFAQFPWLKNPAGWPTLKRSQTTWLWGTLLLAIAAFSHGYNMFGYPLYLGDEGIYMSQAYAIAKLGKITPYTYWYDHSPVGWIQIALWSVLTGGFFTFGTAIDSGRVFMLVLHLGSVLLLYALVLRFTGKAWLAFVAGLLYTLSPLSLSFGRQVLLDNIMTFWMLLSAYVFLDPRRRVTSLIQSGLCFGIAVLSKENAILLLPAFTYGLWTLIKRRHYNVRFARVSWLFMACGIISLYLVFATLRGELIPLPWVDNNHQTVSLFKTLFWQTDRKADSLFWQNFAQDWWRRDSLLLLLGALTTVWCVLKGEPRQKFVGLLSCFMFLSLMKGGVGLSFYILPMLPLLPLTAAIAFDELSRSLAKLPVKVGLWSPLGAKSFLLPTIAMASIVSILLTNLAQQPYIFQTNSAQLQRDALTWIRQNVPVTAKLAIDDDLWVDLQSGQDGHYPKFPYAHSHWKVSGDPDIYQKLLKRDWRQLDYLVLTPGLGNHFARQQGTLLQSAYRNAIPVARFQNVSASIEVWQVQKPKAKIRQTVQLRPMATPEPASTPSESNPTLSPARP